jgi:predicted PurR-regulated permease PerM
MGTEQGMGTEHQRQLPGPVLRIGAAYTWRILVLGAAAYVAVRLLSHLLEVIVPLGVALLLSSLLHPLLHWLRRHRVPQSLATLLSVLVALVVIVGLAAIVVVRAVDEFPQLGNKIDALLPHLRHWLETGPLHVNRSTVNNFSKTVSKEISSNSSSLLSAAAYTGRKVVSVAAGILLTFFITVFFLYDGPRVWRFVCLIAPSPARDRFDRAGRAAWVTIGHYARGTLVVAVFHGVAIAIVLAVLGVPLVLPLAVLVALGSFVPIVGAVVTGLLAVAVAGVTNGVAGAIVVAVVLVADNQIEAHVLQPFVVGRYVRIHPLATVLSLTAGTVLGGILGAIFVVPLVACASAAVRILVVPDPPPLDSSGPSLATEVEPSQAAELEPESG